MLTPESRLAMYMEGALTDPSGKMGHGVLRYGTHDVRCVIDSRFAGGSVPELTGIPRDVPIVATLDEAVGLGANVLLLGIAPPGGALPQEWRTVIRRAVSTGMSIVNGLHDRIAPDYPDMAPGQFVWDLRVEPPGLGVATGAARELENRRVLMIGTDMACGKMTAGLELLHEARRQGIRAAFVATGQIGMTITGSGIPLDAIRVDYAAGAVEREVLEQADAELVIVEGQGAPIHPSSTSPLPLLRGSCPTHFVLCHRAGWETLQRVPWVRIPPLNDYLSYYQNLAEACGVFRRPIGAGVALDTSRLDDAAAEAEVQRVASETNLPTTDPVRYGAGALLKSVMSG